MSRVGTHTRLPDDETALDLATAQAEFARRCACAVWRGQEYVREQEAKMERALAAVTLVEQHVAELRDAAKREASRCPDVGTYVPHIYPETNDVGIVQVASTFNLLCYRAGAILWVLLLGYLALKLTSAR
jgi:hypothetical protein